MQIHFEEILKSELQKLYSVETQLLDNLKVLASVAQHVELKNALELHRTETEEHVSRIVQVCESHGWQPVGLPSKAMKSLGLETMEALNGAASSPLLDQVILVSARKSEHFEIGSYVGVVALLRGLGDLQAAALLEETLQEEQRANGALAQLQEASVMTD